MNRAALGSSVMPRGVLRRRSLLPSSVFLLLAVAALVAFIGVVGDARRMRNAMKQAEAQAVVYAERAGETKALPLNLEPDVPSGLEPKLIDFESLPFEQARVLREADRPVLAAWTVPILRFFGRDGRAAILFSHGRFEVKWMTLAEFEEAKALQATLVGSLTTVP
jgi:hypothetical protein